MKQNATSLSRTAGEISPLPKMNYLNSR
uniref:Uncharacterized protein n=1 Tax=Rhizophora mucronata TaxID=61149 RepID=A0A2P2MRZ7_RHIMU